MTGDPSCLQARAFVPSPSSVAAWDELVGTAWSGTFMHTRRFLGYHRDRFVDASADIVDGAGTRVACLPAAVDPGDPTRVVTHPGATYGGIVHAGPLGGAAMIEAFQALAHHYRRRGFRRLRYKLVPAIYHAVPAADDTYALFRLGATRYRCDLSCTIDLAHRLAPSARRRRAVRQALARRVSVQRDPALLPDIWAVVEENLQTKHHRRPVHTLAEMAELHRLFPRVIQPRAAVVDGRVVAGLILYAIQRTVHAQYIATRYHDTPGALDVLIESAIEEATAQGARYFDFGISNEADGQVLNEGLHRFKSEFGAGTTPYEFYELDLAGDASWPDGRAPAEKG